MSDGADTVEVWLIDGRAAFPDLDSLLALLGPQEQRRAAACLSQEDRREYVIAHAALHCIVGERIGVAPAQVTWRIGPHGKPHLSGHARSVEVNLSHSGDLCMVAVSASRPVGVDIQRLATGATPVALARRYFPAEEARLVLEADDAVDGHDTADADDAMARSGLFARLWTRKEAFVKAAGSRLTTGLAVSMSGPAPLTAHARAVGLGPVRVDDLEAPPGYRAAIALTGAEPFSVVSRTWQWPVELSQPRATAQMQPCKGS
ncbi:MAG TPA: 4'-phosphopantetheinyl transferase superfamily protein [Actinocrinis sp.]|nr:4'-phosphopantetheinyl transferase superfamily protein [Actinocrinis sp.]